MIAGACVALALGLLGTPETPPALLPVEIVAEQVEDGLWGSGAARRASLENAGYDADVIQAIVNENLVDLDPVSSQLNGWVPDPDGSVITPRGGVNWYFDQYETWYDLDMSGVIKIARAHGIGGEYWEREDGAKMLGDYIMLATNNDIYPIGTLVPTSLGMGISLDTGDFAAKNPYQIDIATNWSH